MKEKMLEDLQKEYPDTNIIAIFGGIIFVKDINDIVYSLPNIIKRAKFFGWQDTIESACKTFCFLCGVDPMLVEAYIGMKFKQLIEEYKEI